MTDNENLDDVDGKDLNNYQKQRLKFQEKLDAKDARIAELEAKVVADKKAYFKSTLANQWIQGNFDEFADKYADKLELDEMVALYKGNYWWATVTEQPQQYAEQPAVEQQPQIWPKSVIWTNPITGDQPKTFADLSLEEMKARGRAHPELLQ